MPSPGWYPDPQDSTGLRWFDGENWSDFRQSAAEVTASAGPALPPETRAQPSPSAYATSAFGASTYDPYAARASTDATAAIPTMAGVAGAAGAATEQLPRTVADMPPAPVAVAPRAAKGPSAPNSRLILIIALVVVLLAGLITGGWLLFAGGSSTTFTYQGKAVKQASSTLTAAEGTVSSIVNTRSGNQNGSTRCYFAVPANPTSKTKHAVDSSLRCGPVLFVDGDASKAFLSFALTATPVSGGVTLASADQPASNTPAAVPSNLVLQRPDGKTPPSDNGGLTVPAPPPTKPNSIASAPVPSLASKTPGVALMGSLSGGITIDTYGKVSRYGTGDQARSAPSGQQLIAFTVAGGAGNDQQTKDLTSSTTLVVDGAAAQTLPVQTKGNFLIAVVPTSAKTVNLVLNDSGISQTYSLLDAKPGASNIQVLARPHPSLTVGQTLTATYNYSTKVVFSDGVTGQTQTASIALASAMLVYRDDVNNVTASGTDKAFLIPDIVYTGSHDGGPYGIDTTLLTLTPTGGAAIAAKNISTDPTKIRNVFEVPANITTATLTVGGTASETFSGGTGSYTVAVATPISFQLTFPTS